MHISLHICYIGHPQQCCSSSRLHGGSIQASNLESRCRVMCFQTRASFADVILFSSFSLVVYIATVNFLITRQLPSQEFLFELATQLLASWYLHEILVVINISTAAPKFFICNSLKKKNKFQMTTNHLKIH